VEMGEGGTERRARSKYTRWREGGREGGRAKERTSRFPGRGGVVEQDAQNVFDEEAEARVAQHQGAGLLGAARETEGREGGREGGRAGGRKW
jgi:hypothetical protein